MAAKASIRVRHFGNTANNAYYNARVLAEFAGIESELPIAMFGLNHGMSAPAWEAVDFDVSEAGWVHSPDWASLPEALAINADYADLAAPSVLGEDLDAYLQADKFPKVMDWARRDILPGMRGKRWANPIFDLRDRQILARRMELPELDDEINLLYGADSLARLKVPNPTNRTVILEHGTLRWLGDGAAESRALRRAYKRQVQSSQQIWVTNLDPRTLEIAEDVAPGRWSVLPHPFVLDPRVPFAGSEERRTALLERTKSSSLVLLPSSQNWSKGHDKGSNKALDAFIALRRAGVDVGLVAVEWGLQVAESKRYLERAGVGQYVAWVVPMARLTLQRMMADVDVVWDQFGLDAFGALAIRATEQGAPLVSRGLSPVAEQLIGGPVPWRDAAETEHIVRETTAILDEMARRGRQTVIDETRATSRGWLLERHSSQLTADLQREVYERIIDGTFEPGSSEPGRWAQLLQENTRENG